MNEQCFKCVLFGGGIVAVIFVVAGPWLAVKGPWVKYYVNVDLVPDDAETAELYLQYPMLMFERQQHSSEMCFTRVSTEIFKIVFHSTPRVECRYDDDDDDTFGTFRVRHRNYRCVVWYCISQWNVMINNNTMFSHHVQFSMGRLYSLLVADACWFVWWAPGLIMFFAGRSDCCTGSSKILLILAGIYLFFAFAGRVALCICSMIEFYRYDSMMEPPHGGYVQNSPLVQVFTTRSYGWGFICEWIVIVGNGLIILGAITCAIYAGVVGCKRFTGKLNKTQTRVTSIHRKSSKNKPVEPTAPSPDNAIPLKSNEEPS